MIIFFSFLAMAVGSDLYIWHYHIASMPSWVKIAWWLPLVMMVMCLIMIWRGDWDWATPLAGIIVCMVVPKLIFCALSLIGKALSLLIPAAGITCAAVGMALAVVVAAIALYGMVAGWKRLTVNEVTINHPTRPKAFDGYRIVLISDFHIGTFGNDSQFPAKVVDSINALSPDLIVFTGDLVNFTVDEALPYRETLSRLKAADGVVSILGNHDYALYALDADTAASQRLTERLCKFEREIGWRLLLDENFAVTRGNDSIWIAGVQNTGRRFSAGRGSLPKALKGIPQGAFTVLLSHDPDHWEDEVVPQTDVPLTLSGHTHAMQCKIAGWSPSALLFKHWGGLYVEDGQQLYVSTGVGANLPFRIGAWPEIAVITLTK